MKQSLDYQTMSAFVEIVFILTGIHAPARMDGFWMIEIDVRSSSGSKSRGGSGMKIKTTITEIEATAEDLRQSKTLSDCFCDFLKMICTPVYYSGDEEKTEEQEE